MITQAYIKKVKKAHSETWRDRTWHDFASTREYEAVTYALSDLRSEIKVSLKDIQTVAKKYLAAVYD